MHNGEKIGGPRRGQHFFKPFVEMLEVYDMLELSGSGNRFTWGGRRGDHWIQSRLDRAFGNKDWFEIFPTSNQDFLEMRGSDHRPVLVKLVDSQEGYFHFDKRFLHKADIRRAITRAWKPGVSNGGLLVAQRIRDCRKVLSSWNKTNYVNSKDKIHQCEVALERVQSERWPNLQQVHILKRELAKAYRAEETYWRQHSKHG
ncbi:PREDICTED: uncharacterized protein LOC104738297 [Camelina sativa]|uniref:Uncharacterized protein LOC104738297 n=1 Tax=Camelina sativa TaxID=90675 RepID=A0ABM0VIP3_CAMSA|nr:PREDICTED: uncharacterized protein LOC104738297 [Camelina sativa]